MHETDVTEDERKIPVHDYNFSFRENIYNPLYSARLDSEDGE